MDVFPLTEISVTVIFNGKNTRLLLCDLGYIKWTGRVIQYARSNNGCAVVARNSLHVLNVVGGASFANFPPNG